MSTTSIATTSAARDQIPSDYIDLLNCTCIWVLTRGDGIPFDATSIQEEDIVVICVCLGHTHPEGVLRYFAMEYVMLFHSADDMLVAAQEVIKMMTLCEEAIKIRSSPPSATHVRAYMVTVDGNLQVPNIQPQIGKATPNIPFMIAIQVGVPCTNCR